MLHFDEVLKHLCWNSFQSFIIVAMIPKCSFNWLYTLTCLIGNERKNFFINTLLFGTISYGIRRSMQQSLILLPWKLVRPIFFVIRSKKSPIYFLNLCQLALCLCIWQIKFFSGLMTLVEKIILRVGAGVGWEFTPSSTS